MEELYQYLEERLLQIKATYNKFPVLINQEEFSIVDLHSSTSAAGQNRDLTQYLHQIKKIEKLRILKENEILETLFAFKPFEVCQKKRFHEKSYYFMKMIKTDFAYAKYKPSEENKDIAKLYLNFFLHTNMQSRIDDLRRAYSCTKSVGHSFMFILMKWLIEITRNMFQNLLKQRMRETQVSPSRDEKMNTIHTTNIFRSRSASKQRAQSALKESYSRKQHNGLDTGGLKPGESLVDQAIRFINLSPIKGRHYEDQAETDERIPTINLCVNGDNCLSDNRLKNNFEDGPIMSSNQGADCQNSQFNLNNGQQASGKQLKKTPVIHSIQGNMVQLHLQSPYHLSNHVGLLEDLEITHGTFPCQPFSLTKNTKKVKTGSVITIDLDKRKDMINHVYRTLYCRNLDVEKTINNYNSQLFQKNLSNQSLQSQQRKSENFCDNMVIDFPRMFPHLLPDEIAECEFLTKKASKKSTSPSKNRKSIERKQEVPTPKVFRNTRPVRSESIHSRTQRTSNIDGISFKTQTKLSENEEIFSSVALNTAHGYKTENRFRIMKKKMVVAPDLRELVKNQTYESKFIPENYSVLPKEITAPPSMTESFSYCPRSYKEAGIESISRLSINTKEFKFSSYSIYNRNKSVSVSKVKSNQLIDYTMNDSHCQTKTYSPEKISEFVSQKSEQFNLLHAVEYNQIEPLNED